MLKDFLKTQHAQSMSDDLLLSIRWLAFDLDRTLIGPDKQLHLVAIEALQRACDLGYRIIIATGRPPRSTRLFIKQINREIAIVCYNGGYAEGADGEKLCDDRMDASTAIRVLDAMRMGNPGSILMEVNDTYHFDEWNEFSEKHMGNSISKPTSVGRIDYFVRSGVNKFLAIGTTDSINITEQKLHSFASDQEIIRPTLYKDSRLDYIEVMPRGVTKRSGIDAILNRYGWNWNYGLIAGDALNDFTMLQSARLRVVVEDGCEEAINTADYICPSAKEDGVATWLNVFLDKVTELRQKHN